MTRLFPLPFMLACLAACTGRYDLAGYRLPDGPLEGTAAMVVVVSQPEVTRMALQGGVSVQKGAVVNALFVKTGETCVIYLADTPAGIAAIEHELWHCRGWSHP